MDGGLFSINATLGASLSPEAVAALLGLRVFFCFLSPANMKGIFSGNNLLLPFTKAASSKMGLFIMHSLANPFSWAPTSATKSFPT